jgi:signal transduction histidine kinase
MAEQRAKQGDPDETAAGGLYRLAMRLGPLLEPAETTLGALEACAELAGAEAGLLLADGLPPAALRAPAPTPAEAAAVAAAPLVRAAAEMLGVSVLPPGAAPLPGPALVAAALPGREGRQGVLLLSRPAPGFSRDGRAALGAALPLVGQALERCRRHAALRQSELSRDGAVGRLAHDIRSPLVSTHASIEVVQRLLRDQPVPRSVFDALATGLRSVQAAVELCNDLLEVSRLKHGVTLAARPVPLGRLVRDTCQLLGPLAEQRGVTLDSHTPEPEPWVPGDERLLRRLLTNLVANGLRFAPQGGFVRVEGRRGDEPQTALLVVADNGPGVPPEDFERIFVPFAQGLGEAGRGVGLGLALCHEVALAHGGQIRVAARPEGGTEFVVRLPSPLP